MIRIYLLFFIAFGFVIPLQAQEAIFLWPGEVPLATKPKAEPVISDNDKRGVTRIAEVTNPLLKVYQPAESKAVVDAMDSVLARPDFAILIYPAYLDKGENNTLTPELKVSSSTPPMFMFAATDDGHANSTLVMAAALREAKVPVEAHLYPIGGHGYGTRPGNQAAVTWPVLANKWLEDFVLIH